MADEETVEFKPVFELESDYYQGLSQIASNLVPRPEPQICAPAPEDSGDDDQDKPIEE